MIEKQFWINVKEAWIVAAQPKITNVHADSEGATDFSVPDDSEDMEVSFDDIDFDRSVESVIRSCGSKRTNSGTIQTSA